MSRKIVKATAPKRRISQELRKRSVDPGDNYLRLGMVAEHDALLAFFSQPFKVVEPFGGLAAEYVPASTMLHQVAAILGRPAPKMTE